MKKDDYKKEYELLKEKYEELELEYKTINRELYFIKSSRSYKLVLMIRKMIKPFRKILSGFSKKRNASKKVQRFIDRGEKIVVVPSSFEFDEYVNQRPINYAKFLANNGYKVIFVVWQWTINDKVNNSFDTVYNNVLQIPLFDFLQLELDYSKFVSKIFYINFPNELFSTLAYDFRENGFLIHYDIMDDWEEFQKVGQANWYDRSVEEKILLESDYISAVSPYLIDKFNFLRGDIHLSPNGYYKSLTGVENRNISLKKVIDGKVNIGYFGHLTDSWFNWDLIIEIAKKNADYVFHIIGYGLSSETEARIEELENIKYYGKVPTDKLCEYVKNWNIGIILFKPSNLAKAVDPIKIYEYLFMGLPVIVSGIEHMKNYPRTFVIEKADEFVSVVEDIVKDNKQENIDKFLEASTWEARFSKFLDDYADEGMTNFYGN